MNRGIMVVQTTQRLCEKHGWDFSRDLFIRASVLGEESYLVVQ
jgi:hypothetical protein